MEVVLTKDYRPMDVVRGSMVTEQAEAKAGETVDLPSDEAQRAIDLGIAQTPETAAKSRQELNAIELLTDLGYTFTPPKASEQSSQAASN